MKNSLTQKAKWSLTCILFAAIISVCLVIAFRSRVISEQQQRDYDQISSTEYDSVFLSMYPIYNYQEEDYAYYRGMTLFKSSYCIPSMSVLKDYMQKIARSGNQITTAYLGIQPEKTDLRKLRQLFDSYPDITYEIVLPYPSAAYWQSLSQENYDQALTAFCNLLADAPDIPEANFYFFGTQEWLIANPGNYQDYWSVNTDIARTLMANSDTGHGFRVTAENSASLVEDLTTLTHTLRNTSQIYPDLSECCIVFFGDSVIGNYTDSTSIPGVVSGLTGAAVYNCGYGGNSAALAPDIQISLPGITEAFFRKDLSALPKDTQVYAGISSYLESAPSDRRTCFIINYGLNDYFSGYPVASEDPYDITTYSGAIRTAVSLIRQNVPDAQIILCTPTFTSAFRNGTEPHGPKGHVLTDYVNAVLSLSQELQTDVLDNYHDLGITPENEGQYLADQVHPNSDCRFTIGSKLCHILQ